jgi:DNA (cytosine-5)-methyltransferase 1
LAHAISDYEEACVVSSSEMDFRKWLQRHHRYGERSAGNVISRIKRVRRLLGNRHFSDYRDAVHALQKKTEFDGMSRSVRSQLKKAILLHAEFSGR